MQIERGAVRIGVEIEVPTWNGRTYQSVCAELIDAKYMMGPKEQWKVHHQYHCHCTPGACGIIKNGDLIFPPIVGMTYDGTLPNEGAEFIVSPTLLAHRGLDFLEEIWSIVTRDAVWTTELRNYHDDGFCSPSVHLHVSATIGQAKYGKKTDFQVESERIMQCLSLYAPELFAMADMAQYTRGLSYRWPTREAMLTDPTGNGMHHGFIHVRKIIPEHQVYIEWRLFEAAYNEWEYVEGAAYLAAVLTRSLLQNDLFKLLMAKGYSHPFNDRELNDAVTLGDVGQVIRLVNPYRLEALREICLTQIDDDPHGYDVLVNMFNKLEGSLL